MDLGSAEPRARARLGRAGHVAVAATLLALQAGCGADVPPDLDAAIEHIVLEAMEEGPITGVAVGVARGTRVVHRSGYGFADVENRIAVTPETVFRIGSITKQFTAAMVVDLAEEGRLALDDWLTEYLPDYPGYGSEVTIEHLLTHTSGIRNYTTLDTWWETLAVELAPRRLIATFEHEPFDFRPGTRFSYSNSGYVLLGWIVEQVTGQPYGGALNERLLVPLDLPSTRYCDDRALIPNRARGYAVLDGEIVHASHVSMSQAYAAGGLCSNVDDLLRWTQLLALGGAIGRDGYRAMSTPARLADGTPIEYGYGLAVGYLDGHPRVSHVGGMLGFSSQVAHYEDEDVTIVVLTNTEGAPASSIETEIARAVLGLEQPDVRDVPLSPEELARYTGTYDLSLARVIVEAREGRLHTRATVPGVAGEHVLLHQGDHTFVSESDHEVRATFTVEGGRATGFVLTHHGITMSGRRIEP